MSDNHSANDSFIWDFIKIVLISLAIVIPIRYYLIQPFFVRGASMEPSFANGQYLVVDELSYHLRKPFRGEVIVFKYPLDPSEYFIKRIIGLPGETVEIKNNQIIIYNQEAPQGFVLDESMYLPDSSYLSGYKKVTLRPNEYFVLGDNRRFSSDSRQWGSLPGQLIIGRVWLRAWPFDQFTLFDYAGLYP